MALKTNKQLRTKKISSRYDSTVKPCVVLLHYCYILAFLFAPDRKIQTSFFYFIVNFTGLQMSWWEKIQMCRISMKSLVNWFRWNSFPSVERTPNKNKANKLIKLCGNQLPLTRHDKQYFSFIIITDCFWISGADFTKSPDWWTDWSKYVCHDHRRPKNSR